MVPGAAQNDIKGAVSAVARMGAPHRGNRARMAGPGKPVADRSADRAACMRPGAARQGRLAGHQQNDPVAIANRVFER